MPSTQEYIGSPFILIVTATNDIVKYTATIFIQHVYKSFHKEHLRMREYREGVKYKPSLPNKVKCPKLFEVDDQINPILQVFDELDDMHTDQENGKQFWWPSKWAVFENLGCLRFVNVFFHKFYGRLD